MNWLRGKPENDKGRAQLVIAMLDKVIRLKGDINGGGRLRYKLFYMFYYDHVIGYWYSNSSGGRKIIEWGGHIFITYVLHHYLFLIDFLKV